MDDVIRWLTKNASGKNNNDAVLVGYSKTAKGDRINITIYSQFLKELNLTAGDRVNIGETDAYFVLVKSNTGIKLTKSGENCLVTKTYADFSKKYLRKHIDRNLITIDTKNRIWIPKIFK